MIFTGCSTGVPLPEMLRNKPVVHLTQLKDFDIAKDVASIPYVHVKNMETAGMCRVRLEGLQNWVKLYYEHKFENGE